MFSFQITPHGFCCHSRWNRTDTTRRWNLSSNSYFHGSSPSSVLFTLPACSKSVRGGVCCSSQKIVTSSAFQSCDAGAAERSSPLYKTPFYFWPRPLWLVLRLVEKTICVFVSIVQIWQTFFPFSYQRCDKALLWLTTRRISIDHAFIIQVIVTFYNFQIF